MRRASYAKVKLGERFGIQGYLPPAKLIEIAQERTSGFVFAWMFTGSRAHQLQIMANSCYMQGINDAADSLIRAGWKPPEEV